MSLLREIQTSLMQENSDIGPILLKLRFLASRLGSNKLEEWVHYEMGLERDMGFVQGQVKELAGALEKR